MNLRSSFGLDLIGILLVPMLLLALSIMINGFFFELDELGSTILVADNSRLLDCCVSIIFGELMNWRSSFVEESELVIW